MLGKSIGYAYFCLNHSFMMPGLIGVGVATVVAMLIAQVVV